MILAGGRGTRLGGLTAGRPKPLIAVGGKPFIVCLIENLRRFGISSIVLLAGPFADEYHATLGDGSGLGVTLSLVPEPTPADTAGALGYAAMHLAERFFVLNGDSFFDFNVLDLTVQTASTPWLISIALRRVTDVQRYGSVTLKGKIVAAFDEKTTTGPGTINAGVYWMRRQVLNEIGPLPASLERSVLPRLASRQLVRGTVYDGHFIDIGTPEDLAQAQDLMPAWERRPAAFLDRDAVLNLDDGYVGREGDSAWLRGAQNAVKMLNDNGYFVIVVADQSAVAEGSYTRKDIDRSLGWMNKELRQIGAHIDAFYCYPSHPRAGNESGRQIRECNKPTHDILLQAMRDRPIDQTRSFMVANNEIDVAAAQRAGIRSISIHGDVLSKVLAGLRI